VKAKVKFQLENTVLEVLEVLEVLIVKIGGEKNVE
jgi:hypothetical protein